MIDKRLNGETTCQPGILLEPFAWAAERVMSMIDADPSLYPDLFHMGSRRMHLIALALAHTNHDVPPGLAMILLHGSSAEILDGVLGRPLAGFEHALDHIPSSSGVLKQKSYVRLTELLEDDVTANALSHVDEIDIDDRLLSVIADIPVAFWPIGVALANSRFRTVELRDGMRFLATRNTASGYEALIRELSPWAKPSQLIAGFKCAFEALPVPEPIPPTRIERARLLDTNEEDALILRELSLDLTPYFSGADIDRHSEAPPGENAYHPLSDRYPRYRETCALYLW